MLTVQQFQSTTGGGVTARIGKEKLIQECGVAVSDELRGDAQLWQEKAQTVVWVAIDNQAVGIPGIADPIKETTPAIKALHNLGLKVIMCTGNNRRTLKLLSTT